jgi:hypothetical protein
MVDIENIKQKYCMDDDLSKRFNEKMHRLKNEGEKVSKGDKANMRLRQYINNANAKLGRQVEIYEKSSWRSPNPTFGINWAAIGTVGVPETKAFIQKLQRAIEFIQNAPKASGDKKNAY